MKFRVTYPIPRCAAFIFKNQLELALTFLRVQEYYESQLKGIADSYFTLDKFIIQYALHNKANKKKRFDYLSLWTGFNLHGKYVREFYEKFKHELRDTEKELFNAIKHLLDSSEDFYIIGVYDSDKAGRDVFRHELAHAFYYLDSDYRNDMNELIDNLPKKLVRKVKKKLYKEMGYGERSIQDEVHAWLATDKKSETFGIKGEWKASKPLRKRFKYEVRARGIKFL